MLYIFGGNSSRPHTLFGYYINNYIKILNCYVNENEWNYIVMRKYRYNY